MRPPFRTVSDSLAFVAALGRSREESVHAAPLERVLRRPAHSLLQRIWLPLHFAFRMIERAAAPWNPSLPVASLPPVPAPGALRERFKLCTRLLERSLRVLQVRHGSMPVSITPPAPAAPAGAPPSARVVMMQRIERQTFFPRVTQVLARTSSPAANREETPLAPGARVTMPPLAPRLGTPRAAVAVAASLAPAELARVTDHVIRELDQRVLSFRERTGQV
jgi:hypothetical protein